MESPNKEHLLGMLGASFMQLPLWKKVLTVISVTLMSPWILMVTIIVGLSSFPFLLFGRWEGELGKRPLIREATGIVRRRGQNVAHYYATAG